MRLRPRPLLRVATCLLLALLAGAAGRGQETGGPRPNFIVIFCDDMGYGDLGCFGSPGIRTPHLDGMAAEGQKWTHFYAAACVCTPSRAALLTGRYAVRSGMASDQGRRVLFPDSKGGLPASEITLAKLLKDAGYHTACVGKWHLGHLPEFLPTAHGFDHYFGIPYSNDMDAVEKKPNHIALAVEERYQAYNVPLMRDTEIIERPADQRTITQRYTDEAVAFIRHSQAPGDDEPGGKPFFLYLAHNLPHVPLFRSGEFKGRSSGGIYGDVVEEIDESVGQILAAVKERPNNASHAQTYVIFTSDNGPWLTYRTHGGLAGPLRDGKGSTWEGGMRVPGVMWAWPKPLHAGTVTGLGSTLDILPTFASLAGVPLPKDRVLDGFDLTPALQGTGPSPRTEMFFYHDERVFAARKGDYKAHFFTKTSYVGQKEAVAHDPPLLFHVGEDPGEHYDTARQHPAIVEELRLLTEKHAASVTPVENQLERR